MKLKTAKDIKDREALGDFERQLLNKLDIYEEEEETKGYADSDDEAEEEKVEDDESDGSNDVRLPKGSDGEDEDFEEESEEDDDEEDKEDDTDKRVEHSRVPHRAVLQPPTKPLPKSPSRIVPDIMERTPTEPQEEVDSEPTERGQSTIDMRHIRSPADIYRHMLQIREEAQKSTGNHMKPEPEPEPEPEPKPKATTMPQITAKETSSKAQQITSKNTNEIPKDANETDEGDEPLGSAVIIKNEVVEHSDMDSMSGSDFEDYILGREVANEYHQMRQKFLAVHESRKDFISDDAKNVSFNWKIASCSSSCLSIWYRNWLLRRMTVKFQSLNRDG
jgi:hypothetical protein